MAKQHDVAGMRVRCVCCWHNGLTEPGNAPTAHSRRGQPQARQATQKCAPVPTGNRTLQVATTVKTDSAGDMNGQVQQHPARNACEGFSAAAAEPKKPGRAPPLHHMLPLLLHLHWVACQIHLAAFRCKPLHANLTHKTWSWRVQVRNQSAAPVPPNKETDRHSLEPAQKQRYCAFFAAAPPGLLTAANSSCTILLNHQALSPFRTTVQSL